MPHFVIDDQTGRGVGQRSSARTILERSWPTARPVVGLGAHGAVRPTQRNGVRPLAARSRAAGPSAVPRWPGLLRRRSRRAQDNWSRQPTPTASRQGPPRRAPGGWPPCAGPTRRRRSRRGSPGPCPGRTHRSRWTSGHPVNTAHAPSNSSETSPWRIPRALRGSRHLTQGLDQRQSQHRHREASA
jgi:hypothetical protein